MVWDLYVRGPQCPSCDMNVQDLNALAPSEHSRGGGGGCQIFVTPSMNDPNLMIWGKCFMTGDENELNPDEWNRLKVGVKLTTSKILSK